jgi:hypothetical protein
MIMRNGYAATRDGTTLAAVAFILAAALLVGCSTPYTRDTWLSPAGWLGGYSEERLDRRSFLVTFQGNGYTSSITVRKYFLRRCAELTRENGFRYFEVLEENPQTGGMALSTPGSLYATTSPYGAYGTVYPGATIPVEWYSRTGLVRFLTKDEAQRRSDVFDAHEVWKYTAE